MGEAAVQLAVYAGLGAMAGSLLTAVLAMAQPPAAKRLGQLALLAAGISLLGLLLAGGLGAADFLAAPGAERTAVVSGLLPRLRAAGMVVFPALFIARAAQQFASRRLARGRAG